MSNIQAIDHKALALLEGQMTIDPEKYGLILGRVLEYRKLLAKRLWQLSLEQESETAIAFKNLIAECNDQLKTILAIP